MQYQPVLLRSLFVKFQQGAQLHDDGLVFFTVHSIFKIITGIQFFDETSNARCLSSWDAKAFLEMLNFLSSILD
jgi:hypothetical protein